MSEDKKRDFLEDREFTNNEIDSILEFDDEDAKYSFSFFFDDEYVAKFLKVVTQLPVYVHYMQVAMTKS